MRWRWAGVVIVFALLSGGCGPRAVELGFWFEPVSFEATPIGVLTPTDLDVIAGMARAEVAAAFATFDVRLVERHDASYRVRVVQQLQDLRYGFAFAGPAGQSYAISGFGGSGSVSFALLAGNAIGYAPEGATRAEIIEAIGRGVGRAAVHEFAHQLLPHGPMDSRAESDTYEYGFAGRPQQYWGQLRWGPALPLLRRRIATAAGEQADVRTR